MKKYDNYASNLRVLERADREALDNEFIIGGIIDKFSIQFELGWKLLKELLAYEGSSYRFSEDGYQGILCGISLFQWGALAGDAGRQE